jgi:tetratricopeptide (TPR) repeat protein
MGLADLYAYTGRYADAQRELERGAAADEIGNQHAPRAMKLVALAELALASGASAQALPLIEQALALASSDGVVVPAARLLFALGRDEQANTLAASLEKQIQKRRRAYAAVVRAERALRNAKPVEAIDGLTGARTLADVWLVRYTLGRAYVEAGHFAEGLAELEACSKRIGEGAAVFLDDWPTFRYTAPLHYWTARAQEGLGLATSAAKSYDTYLSLRGQVPGDTLAADARRRTSAMSR